MKNIFKRLGIFIEKRHLIIFVIGLLLIVPAIFGAMQIEMATGTETFISTDSTVYKDYDRFNQQFSGSVVLIMLADDDLNQLLHPHNIAAMDAIETEMGSSPHVISSVGPAMFVKHELDQDTIPDDPEAVFAAVTDPATGEIKPQLRPVFPDDEHALIFITLDGKLERGIQRDFANEVMAMVEDADFDGIDEVIVSGGPVFMNELEDMMSGNMQKMFLLSIVLMLVILAVIFKVRGFFAWRWLPLGVVFIGIAYAFGIMGVLSIHMTMVSMGAFPILIGLGVDYAIQFHNRYDEESRRGETVADAIIDSVSNIGPTIGIAIATACLGFAALFFSPVPMIQEFGYGLIIGVAACYVLSMFFLTSILHWHRSRRAISKSKSDQKIKKPLMQGRHWLDSGLHRLAPWVIKNPVYILPIALILSVAGLVADFHIETETDEKKFIDHDIQFMQDLHAIEDIASGITYLNLLVEDEDVITPSVLNWMKQTEDRISEDYSDIIAKTESVADHIVDANDGELPQDSREIEELLETVPPMTRHNLVSEDGTLANVIFTLSKSEGSEMRNITKKVKEYVSDNPPPDGGSVSVTGEPVIQIKLMDSLTSGREEMTIIGIGIVFLGLIFFFRFKILRVFQAILPIALIIGWSSGVMYLLGIKYTPMTATIGALIIGIGVEFTILLMMRYNEERKKGIEVKESMIIAMTTVGRAIIASGLTVIGGFGTLLIADDFLILRDFGIVTLVNVFFALVSTLFVLPTLMVLIDSWREKRRLARIL